MLKSLIAGAALAAAFTTVQSAEAGHRRPCFTNRPVYSGPSQAGWYRSSSGTRYYVPAAPAAGQPMQATAGPPTAQGPGQTVRRFSEEPGVAPAEQTPAQVVTPAPTYRPATPAVSSPQRSGPPRNPVERRLRPGRGWQR
jgi:hypothetical protein